MDDNKFDSILRTKLEDYHHHPAMDQIAMDALHQRQSAATPPSWHSRYRTELLITSGALLIAILFYLGHTLLYRSIHLSEQQTRNLEDQQAEIAALKKEVSRLQLPVRDTVRLIQVQQSDPSFISELLKRISLLEASNRELTDYIASNAAFQSTVAVEDPVSFGDISEFYHSPAQVEAQVNKVPRDVSRETKSSSSEKSLSVKSIRALEKHYRHGIGIRIGPTVDIFSSQYSLGDGRISLNGGILSDFILSPSLGLETGIKYSERFYPITSEQALSGSTLPGIDEALGDLQSAEVDYRLLEIPISLKYRYPLSFKDHWIGSIGYSSLIYLNEDLEYTYEYADPSTNPASIVSTFSSGEAKVYPGTINLSIGMSHLLKNKKTIEGSLFYRHGLGTQGIEKTRALYFGLSATYWFTAK